MSANSNDGKATVDQLSELHGIVARKLKEKIEGGEATASDCAQAIKFLKDNGIEANVRPGGGLSDLTEALEDKLPFSPESDTAH